MAISVRRLCRDIKKEFRIYMLAGAEGLDKNVNWVHIIEDCQVADFLRGDEIVITTGIGNLNDDKCMAEFVERLHEKNVSALMINVGPYIKEVPRNVIENCNKISLPLFVIPWDVRLVDLTRYFCGLIMQHDEKEKNRTSLIKDFIFQPSEREMLYDSLLRNGFLQHLNYCVIFFGIVKNGKYIMPEEKEIEKFHEMINWEISKYISNYVIFRSEKAYVLVTAGLSTKKLHAFIDGFKNKKIKSDSDIYIMISDNKESLARLPDNYTLAQRMSKLAVNIGEKVLFYDKLGVFQLFLEINNNYIIKRFVDTILLPIIEYDEINGSDYMDFICVFLESNASVADAANKMFVHRNTIHYKINKIKQISGIDLNSLDDILKVKMCMLVRNML